MKVEEDGLDEAQRALEEIAQRLADPSPALRVIGADVVDIVHEAFDTSRAPNGTPWAPLKGPRRHGRDTGAPKPLIDTSRLRNSINYSVAGKMATVGTNVVYAPTHQWGTTRVPARPFLPVDDAGQWAGSPADIAEFERLFTRWLETGRLV